MKIAILGTGVVGRSLAAGFQNAGHTVTIGTRDPEKTLARDEPDGMGNPPFKTWHADNQTVGLAPFRDAAASADLIVNASNGQSTLSTLEAAGAENLSGKILIDVANPLDFSNGFPPTLSVCNDDSLAEQIQSAFPGTHVVKSLNTMNAFLMVDPKSVAGGDHTVFVSGNDEDAKQAVSNLLTEAFGWSDIIDVGDITTARGTEMLLPIWVRLYGALGTPNFNFKIVR